MNLKLTPQIKVALTILGVVLIALAAAFGLLRPQWQKAAELDTQKTQAQADLLAARTKLAYRTQLKASASKLATNKKTQEAKVPQQANLSQVLREIQDMAYENNHWMTSIKNATPVNTEGAAYKSWQTQVVVEGNWLDTLSFLRDLRDLQRQVRVTKVTFDRVIDMTNTDNVPNRVIKHWNPGKYPVRTTIECQIYYIPSSAVSATGANVFKSKTGGAQ